MKIQRKCVFNVQMYRKDVFSSKTSKNHIASRSIGRCVPAATLGAGKWNFGTPLPLIFTFGVYACSFFYRFFFFFHLIVSIFNVLSSLPLLLRNIICFMIYTFIFTCILFHTIYGMMVLPIAFTNLKVKKPKCFGS